MLKITYWETTDTQFEERINDSETEGINQLPYRSIELHSYGNLRNK